MKDRYGLESEPTVKDAHSPAGQTFYAPANYADLPDCPVCKYGTPMRDGDVFRCIDCGAIVTSERRES